MRATVLARGEISNASYLLHIRRRPEHVVQHRESVDTRQDPERARQLKAAWTHTALERLEAGRSGSFGYSVFAVSKQDLQRVNELHLAFVRAMQDVIASSEPSECVALYCSQLLDLSGRALGEE